MSSTLSYNERVRIIRYIAEKHGLKIQSDSSSHPQVAAFYFEKPDGTKPMGMSGWPGVCFLRDARSVSAGNPILDLETGEWLA